MIHISVSDNTQSSSEFWVVRKTLEEIITILGLHPHFTTAEIAKIDVIGCSASYMDEIRLLVSVLLLAIFADVTIVVFV